MNNMILKIAKNQAYGRIGIDQNSQYPKISDVIIKHGDYSIIRYGANHFFRFFRSGFWYEHEPLLTIGLDGVE